MYIKVAVRGLILFGFEGLGCRVGFIGFFEFRVKGSLYRVWVLGFWFRVALRLLEGSVRVSTIDFGVSRWRFGV